MSAENNVSVRQVLDKKALRRAFGNFATGITVVTAQNTQHEQVGMTINSFSSVSLDPALILWCIDKKSYSFRVFEQADYFAVNVLSSTQMDLSNHFARHQADKFQDITYYSGLGNAPILPNCSAVFECKKHAILEGGDHWIIIGEVQRFIDDGRKPLLYHQGAYSEVLPLPNLNLNSTENHQPSSKHLEQHLYYLLTQAVYKYEDHYEQEQAKHFVNDFRTSELRILFALGRQTCIKKQDLSQEIAIPIREIQQATDVLLQHDVLTQQQENYMLTEKGKKIAAILYQIAETYQKKILDKYTQQEQKIFKQILQDFVGISS